MSPRIISVICSLFGKDFLVKCLEPPFKALQEMLSKELFFEVNPMNVEENLLQQNIENLRTICQIFLDSVLSQREYLPQFFFYFFYFCVVYFQFDFILLYLSFD